MNLTSLLTTSLAVRRLGAALLALPVVAAVLLATAPTATAAIAPTVPLATSANYVVLGASTVTNTGDSILGGSLGLWPGTSITGFPPGLVLPPGTTDTTNAAAQQAQADLTAAYVNAAGRPLDATMTADLANLNLPAGVYAGPSKGALSLTGPLVLDGAGDPNSVFIFQTDSTLITGSSSTVSLINGAQACNVFWQVGSSATLGTSSVFVGNILALTSITVNNSVTVHGRALARNGAVTLDNDTFIKPTCASLTPGTGTGGSGSTTTTPGGSTPTTAPDSTPTTGADAPGGPGGRRSEGPGAPSGPGRTAEGPGVPTAGPGTPSGGPGVPTTGPRTPSGGPGVPTRPSLPVTGIQTVALVGTALALLTLGTVALSAARRSSKPWVA